MRLRTVLITVCLARYWQEAGIYVNIHWMNNWLHMVYSLSTKWALDFSWMSPPCLPDFAQNIQIWRPISFLPCSFSSYLKEWSPFSESITCLNFFFNFIINVPMFLASTPQEFVLLTQWFVKHWSSEITSFVLITNSNLLLLIPDLSFLFSAIFIPSERGERFLAYQSLILVGRNVAGTISFFFFFLLKAYFLYLFFNI